MNSDGPERPLTFSGIATSRGFARGSVFLHLGKRLPEVPVRQLAPADVPAECARYEAARAEAHRQIEALAATLEGRFREESEIFRNHLALLNDELIVDAIRRKITGERLNAEAAVHQATDSFRQTFQGMEDPYIRERVRDIDDIERRTLAVLSGVRDEPFARIDAPVIIVAEDLTPSDTVAIPRAFVLGLATDRGSATSHVALLARALGIPAVTGLKDATARVRSGDPALLDGTNGVLTVRPDAAATRAFNGLVRRERHLIRMLTHAADAQSSLDVALLANVQPGVPVETLRRAGAVGVGLYRTEYLWIAGGAEPTEERQNETYADAVRETNTLGADARTVFRALDIGGDKALKDGKKEENPFLGCRSIRYLLANRETFRRQLRAMLRASVFGKAAIMFPMVATLEELREAKRELERAKDALRAAGEAFDGNIPCGMMVEIPSAALNADLFAKEVDFFSIGTNDLVQYTMAADRGNPDVANLYQPTNPAIIRLVDMTCRAAEAAGIPVSVCGESASDPVTALVWTALGVRGLSMNAAYIPAVRKALLAFPASERAALAEDVRAFARTYGAAEIYGRVRARIETFFPELGEIRSFFAPA